jgi:DNA topoisomerase-2
MDNLTELRATVKATSVTPKVTHGRLNIDKLDDAEFAMSKDPAKRLKCILYVVEGDSAKSFVISGRGGMGFDEIKHVGIFPIRGKLMNIQSATPSEIAQNEEVDAIMRIVGLIRHVDYSIDSNFKTLRYGRIMITTDADDDGFHIKGLLMNMIVTFWPELVARGFLAAFITPIVSAGSNMFYTQLAFSKFMTDRHGGAGKITYYKGLGSYEPHMAKTLFKKPRVCTYTEDGCSKTAMDKAFLPPSVNNIDNIKMSDVRKQWLTDYWERDGTTEDIDRLSKPISEFVDEELVTYSAAAVVRAIPSICDGFKPSQRKVLFACREAKFTSETGLVEVCGDVMKRSAYHHGPAAIEQCIVKMAQNFVGSNNINLLSPHGQFGNRVGSNKHQTIGGNAAAARYIRTKLNPITEYIYRPEDDAILNYLKDGSKSIEPQWYIPIIPMGLVNGADGIGTGWSTVIPSFNPIDIIANIRRRMCGAPMVDMMPWIRGFTGTISMAPSRPDSKFRYLITGKYSMIKDDFRVLELPIGTYQAMSFSEYKVYLRSLTDSPSTITNRVHRMIAEQILFVAEPEGDEDNMSFLIKFRPKMLRLLILDHMDDLLSLFKLTLNACMSNMHLFVPTVVGEDEKIVDIIRKFDTPLEIINYFYDVRVAMYAKRMESVLVDLGEKLALISAKARFIELILSGKIVIMNGNKPLKTGAWVSQIIENSFVEHHGSYDYLTNLAISSLTEENLAVLIKHRDELSIKFEQYQTMSPINLWTNELNELETML